MRNSNQTRAVPMRLPVVAIDGPAGVGKSTVSKRVAERLNFTLLDTGALYRGVAWVAKEQHIGWDEEDKLAALIATLKFAFTSQEGRAPRLFINDQDCSEEIRKPDIALGASQVSAHPTVRMRLLGLQRELGAKGGCVVEGRDIGTVVFPDAEVKVYLTADLEVRGKRRLDDLNQRRIKSDLVTVIQETRARDAQDQQRATAPLKPADDAVIVNTGTMTIEQVVDCLVELVAKKTSARSDDSQ